MYNAIISSIRTYPHTNADNIQLGQTSGYQVVIGKDIKTGDLGIYFPEDGQLSSEFCKANDLVSYKDEEGNKKGGYFSEKRRVRTQKFRGEKSEGFWMPLSSLEFTKYDLSKLKEGDQISELNKIPLCNKYVTQATMHSISRSSAMKSNKLFAKHTDTKQLKMELGRIPTGSLIYITEKLHGTSGRFGYVLDEVKKTKLEVWRDFLALKGYSKTKKVYSHINGSRNIILGLNLQSGFYGSDVFRKNVTMVLEGNLHKGEILYYEIVGYTSTGRLIMPEVSTSAVSDEKFTKKYGKTMVFKYKNEVCFCSMYVYKITNVNEDGKAITLSWEQTKRRCVELGVKTVPELCTKFLYDGNEEYLSMVVNGVVDGESSIDPSHVKEGVCIRIEHGDTTIVKHKGFNFKVLEGIVKDKDDYVDEEESN